MAKTKEQIHYNMSRVRSKGTDIEEILDLELRDRGLLFEENVEYIFGKPDFAFLPQKVAIFCDSEFWHGFDWNNAKDQIKSHRDFWIPKIENNIRRDSEVNAKLKLEGWTVLRFWGSEIKHNTKTCGDIIQDCVEQGFRGYRAIDLFAGIGGIRKGFEKAFGSAMKTVFVSEIDANARKTYLANYDPIEIDEDITKTNVNDIPSFDICMAGFPCQAFSMAGQKQGFNDDYKGICRGTLFFEILRICEVHRPKVIFCENVKGLLSNDKHRTIKIIQQTLDALGYNVFIDVLNSKDFGVPQNRERVYIVAFDKALDSSDFKFPQPTDTSKKLSDIIETEPVPVNYYLSECYFETLKRHRRNHESKGHGFGYIIRKWSDLAGAIMCGGMGRERNLIYDDRLTDYTPITKIKGGVVNGEHVRTLTPREWARLQGFEDSFVFPVAKNSQYKQLGNSVTVSVIEAIAHEIKRVLDSQ